MATPPGKWFTRPMSRTSQPSKQQGFTIIELLISIVLSGVVVTVFVSTLMSMVKTAAVQKVQLELSEKNQIALNTIERDIRIAHAFDTTPMYAPFTDSYGPDNTDDTWSGAWSYKGSNPNDPDHRVLILRENATTTNPFSISKSPVHIQGFITNPYAEPDTNLNCTAYNASTAPGGALVYNAMLPYYLIYFVRDGNLYRRTLTDTTTALCGSTVQYQKQSCPKADVTPHSNCRAYDELIVSDVASFSVAYNSINYDSGTTTITDIDAYSQSASDIFDEISNVVVTLKLQRTVNGSDRGSTLSVRVSRVN